MTSVILDFSDRHPSVSFYTTALVVISLIIAICGAAETLL